jgi:hypothetical protein
MNKKILLAILASATMATAQIKPTESKAKFEMGSGLVFSFNDNAYLFRIGGMVQPYIGIETQEDRDTDYFLNSRRSYFNIGGEMKEERLSFFVQLDFSLSDPLLDAWIGFHPVKNLNLYLGQKQSIANNREMQIMETHLQYPGRSLMSTSFSETGRELGLFVDYHIGKNNFKLVPQIAVTSGDGRNSFGSDSRDIDQGGFKYAARLDVYPLGDFSPGNDKSIADMAHENSLKLVLGAAASFNDGASESRGEGHSMFALYDLNGSVMQPDYRQLYGDILLKYKGFSLLGEYVIATATNLEGSFRNQTASTELLPTEISEYLSLGSGYNLQAGYISHYGFGIDARYFGLMPEFDLNANSTIKEQDGWSVGVSKYFIGHAAKVQFAYTSLNRADLPSSSFAEILFQVIF